MLEPGLLPTPDFLARQCEQVTGSACALDGTFDAAIAKSATSHALPSVRSTKTAGPARLDRWGRAERFRLAVLGR